MENDWPNLIHVASFVVIINWSNQLEISFFHSQQFTIQVLMMNQEHKFYNSKWKCQWCWWNIDRTFTIVHNKLKWQLMNTIIVAIIIRYNCMIWNEPDPCWPTPWLNMNKVYVISNQCTQILSMTIIKKVITRGTGLNRVPNKYIHRLKKTFSLDMCTTKMKIFII